MDLSDILTHLGEDREQYFNAVAPPIIQSSNFACPTVEAFRNAFRDELDFPLYTRGCNPTVAILRKKMAALEGAEDALVFSSGAAACSAAIIANLQAGDHVICVQKPYAWTYKLLSKFLSRFGVTCSFVDGTEVANFRQAIRPNTKLMVLESPNSLSFEIQDIPACVALAKEFGLITLIDNSYCSPLHQRPIEMGVDIVMHSATKYLSGHSDVVAGVVCANKEMIRKIFNSELMTLGANISPNDAWLVLRGLRTLPLRLERSEKSALKLIAYLEKHPKVDYILYPLHPSHPQYELAKKQMSGAGGLFSVNFKTQDMAKMEEFCNAMSAHFLMAVSWGGHESLQVPTCAFYGLNPNENPPLPFTFVRYYVGLEEPDYLIAAFEEAFKFL